MLGPSSAGVPLAALGARYGEPCHLCIGWSEPGPPCGCDALQDSPGQSGSGARAGASLGWCPWPRAHLAWAPLWEEVGRRLGAGEQAGYVSVSQLCAAQPQAGGALRGLRVHPRQCGKAVTRCRGPGRFPAVCVWPHPLSVRTLSLSFLARETPSRVGGACPGMLCCCCLPSHPPIPEWLR